MPPLMLSDIAKQNTQYTLHKQNILNTEYTTQTIAIKKGEMEDIAVGYWIIANLDLDF